ncbi:MAG: FG-GAP-like repeat-containing protein [Tepidisphaeraceae bacterium]
MHERVTGDFNNDQKQDVAYTNGLTSGVIVHLGDGNFGLGSPNFYAIGSDQIAGLTTADFDGNGSLDIAGVTSDLSAAEEVGVLINNGNGTFQAADLYPAGESPGTIGAADLSGDGKPDIYVQSTIGNAASLATFQNNGDGTFAAFTPIGAPDSTAAGGGGQESATGDFNSDGSPDIAYVAVVGVQHAATGGAALIYLSPPAPAGILGQDGVLRITGSDAADVVAITRAGGNVRVSKNGIVTNFPFVSVVSIDVRPAGGNDVVTLGPNIRTTFVDAGTGNDRVLADAALTANVAVTGAGGNDTIVGGGGNDELSGANGKDRILGQGGNDYLLGGASNDYLLGGAGNDICSGAGGKDRVLGDGGNDYLLGGNGNDLLDAVVLIDGVEGIDTVSGNAGVDTGVVRLDDIVAGVENLTTV